MTVMDISKSFSHKDKKYSGADDESYDEYIYQYLATTRDFCMSSAKYLQYFQYLNEIRESIAEHEEPHRETCEALCRQLET